MTRDVIMAGFGGQGIMLMGKILAAAGMIEGMHVTWFPSYGAEMRGGTANCTVVISGSPIGSPIVAKPWAVIAMNQPSLERFGPFVKGDGFLFINSSLARPPATQNGIVVFPLPVTDMAESLGSVKVANIIALSAFCAKTDIVSWESLEKALKGSISSQKKGMIEINQRALSIGREHVTVYK